jgi:hypothetical protein
MAALSRSRRRGAWRAPRSRRSRIWGIAGRGWGVENDAAEVADFKKEVDEGFDEALAEVSAAIAAVPLPAAMTLPGFEPLAPADGDDPDLSPPQPAVPETNPLQERLDLRGDDEDGDDTITSFAPDPSIDWGPHWPKLTRHDDETERDT